MSLIHLKRRFDDMKRQRSGSRKPKAPVDEVLYQERTLMSRAMRAWLDYYHGGEFRMARVYWERRLKREVLNSLAKVLIEVKRKKRFRRNVRHIGRLFKLKLLLRAWIQVRGTERI